MHASSSKYVPLVLASALVLMVACGDRESSLPASPSSTESTFVTADPVEAAPEFVAGAFCPQFPPFGVRTRITLAAREALVLRRIRFAFTDRFGARTLPTVLLTTPLALTTFPGSSPASSLPPSTLPSSSPVAVPGFSSFADFPIGAGLSRTLPFLLQFGCGVRADGTILVDVDTMDPRGMSRTATLSVRVAG